ncbi:hypothetical protein BDR05DRAFT_997594 [Suillus weaverae]|nr:hypothetical protein BDR05DRAFT_997594 [Suillus weaverae]
MSQADDEKDDDTSFYPSDEKTAGRRTMYLVENGQALDEDGDVVSPPLPPPRQNFIFQYTLRYLCHFLPHKLLELS